MESHKFETFAEAAAFAKKRTMGNRNIRVKIRRTGVGDQRVVDIIMVEQKTLKITEPTLPNQVKITCEDCDGIGRFPINSRCARCNGRGYHLRDNITGELYDEIVIAKRMEEKLKEPRGQAFIPEFGTRDDFKKERSRQWRDMKNRYRG